MLQPDVFTRALEEQGFSFFTGVPDSLLKELCACLSDSFGDLQHVIAANEGAAVGLACGYHLATGKAGVVYMQNSGIGNAINPLLSLADRDVYSIPLMVVVGWRGEPGVKDEPQHVKQGRVQEKLLAALGYRYEILSRDQAEAHQQVSRLTAHMKEFSEPVVVLVQKDTFARYQGSAEPVAMRYSMTREQALGMLLDGLGDEDRVVSTTGKTSREIYELREVAGVGHGRDFLTVGSMGHAVMIALGLARFQDRRVVCIDGDGAVLMHMGSMALAARSAPASFIHVLINNGAHESVGGQPTIGYELDFAAVAKEMGYCVSRVVTNGEELRSFLASLDQLRGPVFLEIRVRPGSRGDLGRPKEHPVENKTAFFRSLDHE